MKYTLEEKVIFRTDDGSLWLAGNEQEKIILTPTVARLLHLLLSESGKIMTREEIMDKVWSAHGLEPSNNSLNQYISQIRRNLSAFGLPGDVIKTLPRVGFILSADIIIKEEESTSIDLEPQKSHNGFKKLNNILLSFRGFFFCFSILFFIITPFVAGEIADYLNDRSLTTNIVKIGDLQECSIYAVMMGASAVLPAALNLAKKILNERNISCINQHDVYIFVQNSVLHNEQGRVFASICNRDGRRLLACKDVVVNTWMQK